MQLLHLAAHDVINLDFDIEVAILADMCHRDARLLVEGVGEVAHLREEEVVVDNDGSVAFYGSKIKEASKEKLAQLGIKSGVEIVSVGPGKLLDAGASEGFVIQYVNDQPVSKPQEVLELARRAKRAVYIEGVTAYGKSSYFGFGKDE